MRYRYHDRDCDQVPVRGVSAESIMRSTAFAAGVNDRRTGKPSRYDDFSFDQSEGEAVASAKINRHWDYERGRQWASIAPFSMPLRIDGKLNPKAVALYRAACKRGYTL